MQAGHRNVVTAHLGEEPQPLARQSGNDPAGRLRGAQCQSERSGHHRHQQNQTGGTGDEQRGRFLDEEDRNQDEQKGDIADHTLDRYRQQGICRFHATIAKRVHEHHHRRWAANGRHGAHHHALEVNTNEGIDLDVVTEFGKERPVCPGHQSRITISSPTRANSHSPSARTIVSRMRKISAFWPNPNGTVRPRMKANRVRAIPTAKEGGQWTESIANGVPNLFDLEIEPLEFGTDTGHHPGCAGYCTLRASTAGGNPGDAAPIANITISPANIANDPRDCTARGSFRTYRW